MKKFLIPLLGLFILASASVGAEEEVSEEKASAESTEAASAEDGEPSEEAKKVAKEAAGATHTFDPQTYTCKQFKTDADMEDSPAVVGIAFIWLHGYFSAAYGTDETGPLNEESIGKVAVEIMEYCEENESATFSRAVYKITEAKG